MALSVEQLRTVPLLAPLKEKELRNLAQRMREKTHAAGDVVVREGSGGVGFFMIIEGHADVLVRGEKRATLGPGDFFGEMGLLNEGAVRSASVHAHDGLLTAAMPSWDFKGFVREHPDVAWTLLCTMAARVGDAEEHFARSGAA